MIDSTLVPNDYKILATLTSHDQSQLRQDRQKASPIPLARITPMMWIACAVNGSFIASYVGAFPYLLIFESTSTNFFYVFLL